MPDPAETHRTQVLAVLKLAPLFASQLTAAFTVHDRLHETDPAALERVAPQVRAIVASGESTVSAGLIAQLPALFRPTPAVAKRTLEFFTAQIRNPNTRKAYARSVSEFAAWCKSHGLHDLAGIEPVHVAAYIEQLQQRLSAPSVKQHLAALMHAA